MIFKNILQKTVFFEVSLIHCQIQIYTYSSTVRPIREDSTYCARKLQELKICMYMIYFLVVVLEIFTRTSIHR